MDGHFRQSNWHKIWKVISTAVVITALSVSALGLLATVPTHSPWKLLIVRSGSMAPAIPVGSLLVVRPAGQYQVGDVVTYRLGSIMISHRIVSIDNSQYRTKGDANNTVDGASVPESAVVGKVWLTLPDVGKIMRYVHTPFGYFVGILVPALAIIILEIFNIIREIRRPKSSTDEQAPYYYSAPRRLVLDSIQPPATEILTVSQAPDDAASPPPMKAVTLMVLILLAGAWLGSVQAFFTDTGASTGNQFTAGTWSITNEMVINEVLYKSSCANGQWIELWNGTNQDINLKDWTLRQPGQPPLATIPRNYFIHPGQFALAAIMHLPYLPSCYNEPPDGDLLIDLDFQSTFNDSAGALQLVDPNGNVIDRVEYGGLGQPSAPVNQSIERRTLGFDSAAGDNFNPADFVTRFPSTLGFALPDQPTVVINEFLLQPAAHQFIELSNTGGAAVDISDWTLSTIHREVKTKFPSGTMLAPGSRLLINYFVKWSSTSGVIYLKNAAGNVVDAFNYTVFPPPVNNSWSRLPDGTGAWQLDLSPTPNSINIP